MKYARPALAALALMLAVVGCGGPAVERPVAAKQAAQITPVSLVDQVKVKGFACVPSDDARKSWGVAERNMAVCRTRTKEGSVMALVFYNWQEYSDVSSKIWDQQGMDLLMSKVTFFGSQPVITQSSKFPAWQVSCWGSEDCINSARQLDWHEIDPNS